MPSVVKRTLVGFSKPKDVSNLIDHNEKDSGITFHQNALQEASRVNGWIKIFLN